MQEVYRIETLRILLFWVLILSPIFLNAQISGLVVDSKTKKPLANVDVFISQSSFGTKTDQVGKFALENLGAGFYQLVLYKQGHVLYNSTLKIERDRHYTLTLALDRVKKKASTFSEQEKATIQSVIVGEKVDPSVIEVVNEKNLGTSTKHPLLVRNNLTGYQIHYYWMESAAQNISSAPVWYELLPAITMEQTILWEKERKKIFEGSSRHWLMALVAGKLNEEGYTLQDEKGVIVDAQSLLSASSLPAYVKLTIPQTLTLHYTRTGGIIETSRVFTHGAVDIHTSGRVLNTKALSVEGDMVKEGLAHQLPVDYQPIAGEVEDTYAKALQKFYEKMYVHTDKPYYYPGEALWFKGYIKYMEPTWRDSLSQVVYVELINPKKEMIQSKTSKIDSGFFHNDFILPETLSTGTYYLRAYTNLNRNFGDSNLYVKAIPILHLKTKVDAALGKLEETSSPYLTVTSDKKVYKPREKISLTIQTRDKEGKAIGANLSVSVTDATQVVPIEEAETIVTAFQEEDHRKATDLQYLVEYGVGFRGKFVNDNGKPEQTTLTILQMKPRTMLLATTDEQGFFSQPGLDFYDSASFSVKSDKAKDLPYGRVIILPREMAPMFFKETPIELNEQATEFQQRVITEYEVPKNVRVLNEIEIRGRRMEQEPLLGYNLKRPYGKPDFVLTAKDLNPVYPDLNDAIRGKVPGLVGSTTFSRSATQSINFGGSTLILVDECSNVF